MLDASEKNRDRTLSHACGTSVFAAGGMSMSASVHLCGCMGDHVRACVCVWLVLSRTHCPSRQCVFPLGQSFGSVPRACQDSKGGDPSLVVLLRLLRQSLGAHVKPARTRGLGAGEPGRSHAGGASLLPRVKYPSSATMCLIDGEYSACLYNCPHMSQTLAFPQAAGRQALHHDNIHSHVQQPFCPSKVARRGGPSLVLHQPCVLVLGALMVCQRRRTWTRTPSSTATWAQKRVAACSFRSSAAA